MTAAGRASLGAIAALIDSGLTSPATRAALTARSSVEAGERFLDAAAFRTLQAVAARIVPQSGSDAVDLAARFDARLASGIGDGWRYAVLPADADAHRMGLRGIDDAATHRFGAPFADLEPSIQDAVLALLQADDLPGPPWRTMSAKRYFEDLAGGLAALYYAQPVALADIGYAGFADALGWPEVGLNAREPFEPA